MLEMLYLVILLTALSAPTSPEPAPDPEPEFPSENLSLGEGCFVGLGNCKEGLICGGETDCNGICEDDDMVFGECVVDPK